MELILLSSRHLSLGVFFSCNISWVGTLEGDIYMMYAYVTIPQYIFILSIRSTPKSS